MTTPTSTPITLHVNGKVVDVNVSPEMPLLYALRNDLSLKGPRFGCGLGQCGACSVLIDGVVQRSCVLPVGAAAGRPITTLEGMGTPEKPDPLQQAFIDEQAVQCGYCINGMLIAARSLLNTNPKPTEAQVKEALASNLCRCGTHMRIVRAILKASEA
ncbi:(2Fe-2S)-binding protein [Ralstonia insidiosa]|uniref:(2Fe-2S)-binding protein n=1 Tax=Ralstonia insidiosa TaxID=190721 RepID=A0A191ZZG1_9RALS|nr:(2Fe-2S)-binding protein [Ralstonia insidiosa]ANJ73580.1 (2Fe-2S)-binding protein [Ralstonia insidiosa]KAB0473958.1 (2Fe-2S)-binding protein [Ralstonia insidiosa]MBY4912089.1 (2Fe-2S)-binding protein [Ralstonia insidiosa]